MQVQSAQQLLFGNLTDRNVIVKQSDVEITSDAGLLPIREFDRKWRLTERMVDCLDDERTRYHHSSSEMLWQRLFGILADYEYPHGELQVVFLLSFIASSLCDGPLVRGIFVQPDIRQQ